ncbi:MAG: VWA domain-containing protein [Thermomicrobiales bacterium]
MTHLIPNLVFARGWFLWFLVFVPIVVYLLTRWGRKRRASKITSWLRTSILALLVISLAGPLLAFNGQQVTTIFAIDHSNSIQQESSDAANTWVTQAIENAGSDSAAAIISFGSQPELEVAPANTHQISSSWASSNPTIDGDTTDIASALALARALPVGEARGIVLLSDGAENQNQALEQADQAAADGIPIDVVPLAGVDPGDLRLVNLNGPTALWQGDPLSVLATLSSGPGGAVQIQLLVDGTVASTQQVTLPPGSTSFTLTHPALSPGFHAIAVHISGSQEIDRIPANNDGTLGIVVRDRPSVLLISPDGGDPARLTAALESPGATIKVVTPDQVPSIEGELSTYQAIVLNNVPAWTLSEQQQAAIVSRTHNGGGLIAIGGSASFGPGSYAGTTLEKALPVTVKVTDGRQRPRVAVMIVVDKSGSMSYDPSAGSVSKIDLAKEGILSAASALTKGDQIGVIAFNDAPSWALPMTTLTGSGDQARIKEAISPLVAGGGTELYPALRLAYDSLRNVNADVRHIILLSDGRSHSGTQETYDRLITDIGTDQITLSSIALGSDADLDLLQHLAVKGGGQYHYVDKPADIPSITFQEAQSAGSQSVIRGSFTPIQQQPSPMLTGIDPKTIPGVGGYDFTAARPDAQVVLASDRGDPLLVKWQLGLGRVATWTGDDGSDFSNLWATWNDYAPFWGNVLRWTLPDPENQGISASANRDGAGAVVTVDTSSANGSGAPIDLSNQPATVSHGGSADLAVTLIAAGPGKYQFRLSKAEPGAYALTIPATGTTLAYTVNSSPEWQPSADGAALLQSIAARTGGQVRSLDGSTMPAAGIFARTSSATDAPGSIKAVWQYPLLLAVVLYLLEIAIRLGFSPFRLPQRTPRDTAG